MFIMKQRMHK